MSKIRAAVVGLNMGLQHAYAYAKSERADLRWVVDLDEEKAAKVAKELGCNYTTDWTKIIDSHFRLLQQVNMFYWRSR